MMCFILFIATVLWLSNFQINNYGLITAYDNDYVWIADPAKGEVYSMTQTAAEKLFEQNGKVYYSYMD